MPSRTQRSSSAWARTLSMAKCTARTSSTLIDLAYWMARAVARSRRSIIISATWRCRGLASAAARRRGLAQHRGLLPVALVEPDEHEDQDREQNQDDPGALEELRYAEDDHHGERHHRGAAPLITALMLPPRLLVAAGGA